MPVTAPIIVVPVIGVGHAHGAGDGVTGAEAEATHHLAVDVNVSGAGVVAGGADECHVVVDHVEDAGNDLELVVAVVSAALVIPVVVTIVVVVVVVVPVAATAVTAAAAAPAVVIPIVSLIAIVAVVSVGAVVTLVAVAAIGAVTAAFETVVVVASIGLGVGVAAGGCGVTGVGVIKVGSGMLPPFITVAPVFAFFPASPVAAGPALGGAGFVAGFPLGVTIMGVFRCSVGIWRLIAYLAVTRVFGSNRAAPAGFMVFRAFCRVVRFCRWGVVDRLGVFPTWGAGLPGLCGVGVGRRCGTVAGSVGDGGDERPFAQGGYAFKSEVSCEFAQLG